MRPQTVRRPAPGDLHFPMRRKEPGMTSDAGRDRSGTSTYLPMVVGLALAALAWQVPSARAQEGPKAAKAADAAADRRKALELYQASRHLEALPLLEALAK